MSALAAVNRYLLPGLALKAVVIGGGYATGRELAEFFMPAGPVGGLWGMALAMEVWSLVCALTFLLAFRIGATDYETFFRALLGRFDIAFEAIYFAFLILVLSVFGSAAGAIGAAMFGWPQIVGTLALVGTILIVCAAGQGAAEALFKYVRCCFIRSMRCSWRPACGRSARRSAPGSPGRRPLPAGGRAG